MTSRTVRSIPSLVALAILFLSCAAEARTIRLDTTKIYFKRSQLAVSPGDTICLEPGRRLHQYFQGIHGTPASPIVVTNCPGGRVLIGKTHHYALFFDSSSYIHVTGSGDPAHTYGIHIDGTSSGSGVSVTGLSHHMEFDHLEISGTNFAGFLIKQDYNGAPPSPVPTFVGLSIHHNHIHDVGGEGMYIGETKSPGMLFSEVEIFRNLVVRTGWDGIQTSNMDGVRVHHNVVIASGTANELYQANAIQVGNNVRNYRFDHNVVIVSNENSMNHLGGGKATIDSNWFESPGAGQMLFLDNRTFADTGSTIAFRDNFWRKPRSMAWKIYTEVNQVVFSGNRIGPTDTLLFFSGGAKASGTTETGTLRGNFAALTFVDSAGGDWRIPSSNPWAAWDLGFGTAATTTATRLVASKGLGANFEGFRARGLPMELPHPLGRRSP